MAEFKMPKYTFKGKSVSLDECYQELSHLTYQSPIEIVNQGFQTKLEGDVMEVIHSYGVSVDKDELIKALQYDRNQYEKGFVDGCMIDTDVIKQKVAREIFEEIEDVINNIGYFDELDFEALKNKYAEGEK